ncbi:hypothetical protein B0H16DRAFT_1405862 [Mycena metata]|uniref:Golgi apparatus membrane protein TVP38 n=1 Tax=Mycena metata TaxID=1033252 RepID=A0AAD7NWG6_9AGAR|nr:hypothetical protein B0H16DRAFT_1405862 [Mycena metata]
MSTTTPVMPQPTYADKPTHSGTQYNQEPTLQVPQPIYADKQTYPLHTQDPSFQSNSPEFINRSISRTPSPTPSETDLLNGVRRQRSLNEWLRIIAVLVIVVVVIILIEVFHNKIVDALMPVSQWLHRITAGWLIPIVVLIALSFPPLFGHEIVAMLCGLVWGLGAGFGIVAAGTIIGEICTFFTFKSCLSRRGAKLELTSLSYGTLARVVRDGGLRIAVIARFSALPSHFTTAVFATCGMPFWMFLVSAVAGLPKQVALVYIGVALGESGSKSNKVQKGVTAATVVITVLAMVYIRRLMFKARPEVVYSRRKARQAKLLEGEQV